MQFQELNAKYSKLPLSTIATSNILLCIILGFILSGCGSPAKEDLSYQQHENFAVFKKYCGICHKMSRPLSYRLDENGWRKTVLRMRRKDKNMVPKEAVEPIIQFLTDERHE